MDSTNNSSAELWYFLWCTHEKMVEQAVGSPVIWDAVTIMWRHCNHQASALSEQRPLASLCKATGKIWPPIQSCNQMCRLYIRYLSLWVAARQNVGWNLSHAVMIESYCHSSYKTIKCHSKCQYLADTVHRLFHSPNSRQLSSIKTVQASYQWHLKMVKIFTGQVSY